MWRRLSSEDLLESNPLTSTNDYAHGFVWRVYADYAVTTLDDGGRYWGTSDTEDLDHWYLPLVETPRLFLEFARIHEQKDRDTALNNWIGRYGLLGLQKNDPVHLEVLPPEMTLHLAEYSDSGGPQETEVAIQEEVFKANQVLALYEAALSKKAEKLEQALRIDGGSPEAKRSREYAREASKVGISYVVALVEDAMRHVVFGVEGVLRDFAYPGFGSRGPSGRRRPGRWWEPELLTARCEPRNLLGAMYIQFYWLITSAGELSRCKHCARIISRASPMPGSGNRKPRKDKEFCDDRCRQNHHYHNRMKPKRRGEKKRADDDE